MTPPPEISWKFRRRFAFGFTVLNSGFVAAIIWKLTDPSALKWIGVCLIGSNVILAALYMAGATGTELARIFAAGRSGAEPPPQPPKDGDGA